MCPAGMSSGERARDYAFIADSLGATEPLPGSGLKYPPVVESAGTRPRQNGVGVFGQQVGSVLLEADR